MEMAIKAHQARSVTNATLTEEHSEIVKKAEERIRRRVQGKIFLTAHSGANHCLVPYFYYEEEVYECVRSILEDNGYTVENIKGHESTRNQRPTLPALLIRW